MFGGIATVLRGALTRTSEPPVPYSSVAQTMGSRVFGGDGRVSTQRELNAYGGSGVLFSIVNRLATSTAAVKWHLYQKASSGREEDREEVTSHAALDLWNTPVPDFLDQNDLIEACQQHTDLTGEGWIVLTKVGKLPIGMWPVRPDRMRPVPSRQKFIGGYIYTSPDGEEVPLDLDQVLRLKYPNPNDIFRGMGPVQAILADIDSSRYSAEWNRQFFLNGAEPGGIIEFDQMLSEPDYEKMVRRWREQHQGINNAHRVALIEAGHWVDRKFSQKDMQFAELRQLSDDKIRQAYGFPKAALGDTEDVNRANAETADVIFAKQLTIPRVERWKRMLNFRLLRMYGDEKRYEFDYDSPVPENEELENETLLKRAQAASILVSAGWERAEVLETVNLPAMMAAPEPPPATSGDKVQIPMPSARLSTVERPRATVEAPPEDVPGQLPPDQLPDVSPMRVALDAALSGLMATWAGITAAQIAALVAAVAVAAADGVLADLLTLAVPTGPAEDALGDAMQALSLTAGRLLAVEAEAQGVHIGVVAVPRAELDDVARVTAGLLTDELRVSAARAAMITHGPAVPASVVEDAVRERLEGLSTASTEKQLGGSLHGAMNAGRVATLRAGPVGAVYAQEMNDRNTCGPCHQINGKWLGSTNDLARIELSYPAGAYGGYVGCLGGVNCRGTVTGVWRKGSDK
jgi:HK97 family phage portal protein